MFVCTLCRNKFSSINQYNKHQITHSGQSNYRVKCLYAGCQTTCVSYPSFRKHLNRMHSNVSNESYTCKYGGCGSKFKNLLSLKKHHQSHLAEITDGPIVCGFCSAKYFDTKNAYKIHINRYHRNILDEDSYEDNPGANQESSSSLSGDGQNLQESTIFSCGNLHTHPQTVEFVQDLFENAPANDPDISNSSQFSASCDIPSMPVEQMYSNLYLRLETKNNATEPLIQDIVSTTSVAFTKCGELFGSSLAQSHLSEQDQAFVLKILDKSFGQITNCHDPKTGSLRSTYSRHKLYRSNPKYNKPIKVKLRDKHGIETHCHYTYVPPLKTLQLMLEDDDVRELIDTEVQNPDDDGLFDMSDGNVIKKNEFFIVYRNGLKIVIFQDVFEVCDPLGSAKTMFKIIGVYMMLANLPAHLRSKVNNIKLVLLCFEKYLNEFGWDEILDRFVADMLVLESVGVTYTVNGTVQTRKGTITAGVGDNLGSHCLGGYGKNFSTVQFFSRYCESTLKELREKGFISGPLRTIQSYDEDVAIAMRTGKIYKGLRCNSALNKLQYYHVAKPGLPPCIAHDVFEGIAPFDLFMAIKYFVKVKGWIRLGILNYRLNHVTLASTDRINLPAIKFDSKRSKLVGNASQIRYLIMILPLVLADRVRDFDDPVWKMVVKLRDVCDLLCAPALSYGQVSTLKYEITSYLTLRKSNFSKVPFRPKHGFLQRYFELILEFGPPKHYWTLRFEANHKPFKDVVKYCKNFKDVTTTLAERHELLQSSLVHQYRDYPVAANPLTFSSENLLKVVESLPVNSILNEGEIKYICQNVTFRGIQYAEKMFICVGTDVFGNILLCQIAAILIDSAETSISFIGKTTSVEYNSLVGVYEDSVQECNSQSADVLCFPYSSLTSPDPFLQSFIKSKKVYVSKYAPYEKDL
ncbi:hypothetical protein QAD02_018243 [Eretmocerus hayati]|uniref:Uncharacterized protein n=1 Tax=Eretmocerus hayati TaxID=131215 RepID=A0ACC2PI19_9HYME|nr:hypothetical protein QAD02_018243 [Eretmocerus hayati]